MSGLLKKIMGGLLKKRGRDGRCAHFNFQFARLEPAVIISGINIRRLDILDRISIRVKEDMQKEEDRNIFNAINSDVIEAAAREKAEIECLRKSRKVISSIFELEIE